MSQRPPPLNAPGAPPAIGPYSHAIDLGGLIFLSGQIALDPATGRLVDGDLAEQTRRTLDNIRAVLAAAGLTLRDVVKTTVYLVDLRGFEQFNDTYGEAFGGWRPARTTLQVSALPRGALVEIEAVAWRAPS